MNGEPVFLDVNVPMYAAGREHPYREACVWLMTEIAEGRLEAAIDTEIIQEILYRFGALRLPAVGIKLAASVLELIPVVYPVSPADARSAIRLFERYAARGVNARDVFHAAVMQNQGLTQIISTDTHFDSIEGVQRLDPSEIFEKR